MKNEVNWKARPQDISTILTADHRVKGLHFAKDFAMLQINFLNSVLFTDEIKFNFV